MDTETLRKEIADRREQLAQLETALRAAERKERDQKWFPQGFYSAYYILSGMVLGVVASWVTLLLNIVGAALVEGEPLKLLRIYSTILGGDKTIASSSAVILMFALGVHTLTGAICGAPIHVVYSRYFIGQRLGPRLLVGLVLGVIMWLVNFYGILYWFQPLVLGVDSSYIVDNIPFWVAVASHIAFTETVLLLQPFAVFNAHNYPAVGSEPQPASQDN